MGDRGVEGRALTQGKGSGMSSNRTIRQLGRRWKVTEAELAKAAVSSLGVPRGRAADPNYLLDPYQVEALGAALGFDAVPDDGSEDDDPPQVPTVEAVPVKPDPVAVDDFMPRQLDSPLFLHPDALEGVETHRDLQKRLGVVLHHLAAHKGTSVVKGCADTANKGWLRSPLGGSNGMQYYLWWTKQGAPPAKSLELPPDSIVVRAVRHHDDHTPLRPGELADYLQLHTAGDVGDDSVAGRPWTEAQIRFVESVDPVRVVVGRPGAGKTTVLWKAIEARAAENVLYLTWSRDLRRTAEQYLHTFASEDVSLVCRDFLTFVGEVWGTDVERLPLSASRARFAESVGRLSGRQLGPWADRLHALHGEIRAHLLGAALPWEPTSIAGGDLIRLTDDEYMRRRGNGRGVGKDAGVALLDVVSKLEESDVLASVFPELAAAAQAIDAVHEVSVPPGYDSFDRIVVDEVQDLTLLESAVVVEVARTLGLERGYAPYLLAAGDPGQTVRPTGFDFGPFKKLLAERLAAPAEYQLDENLRCPERIAEVVERVSEKYGDLAKERRPGDQYRRAGSQHVGATLIHVAADEPESAMELLRELEDADGLVILTPRDEAPEWLDESVRDALLTPADAKGLEYQSVCVLDPGDLLESMETAATDELGYLEQQAHRTSIDQLRVALSRATETLAFVDVSGGEDARRLSRELLRDPAVFDVDDLAVHLTEQDVLPEEQVSRRISDARALVDERPRRAWRRAHQAVRFLGDPDVPNGIADPDLREEAHRTLVSTAARLLVDGLPEGVDRVEVIGGAKESLRDIGAEGEEDLFAIFTRWASGSHVAVFDLLNEAPQLERRPEWLSESLVPRLQELREALDKGSQDAATAGRFVEDVESWLRLTSFPGDVAVEARRLRLQAVESLLSAGEVALASAVHDLVDPADDAVTGRVREAEGHHADAAEAFERADDSEAALRNWRAAGDWDRAVALASGDELADLEWLVEGAKWVDGRPSDLIERLSPAEKKRLQKLLLHADATEDS